ncbi:Crp/Fnr family transcriptional regulator [Bacillus sp. EB600]|nr:Crp/Fnr family transcriptional regulator [Bacillus sp. EB600]
MEDFLQKMIFLGELTTRSKQELESKIQTFPFKKGQRVISEEDEARGVFFVQSGVVKLTKQDVDGNEIIVCIKQAGDAFAEACLFTSTKPFYPATATMLQDGMLLFLSKVELERELARSPELALQMISYMSDQLREVTTTLRDVALLDVYSKTVKALERLGKKFNSEQKRWEIEIPLTTQEFATVVGATRESVSRVFSKLKKQGVIEIKPRKIMIIDSCKLCALLQEEY